MRILVASKNPVKIEAVKDAFQKYFSDIEITSYDIKSLVHAQPLNEDIFIGAENRATGLKSLGDANFYVGIEGGIINQYQRWFMNTVACIIDHDGNKSFGTGSGAQVPERFVKEMILGVEMGDIVDRLTNEHNSKQRGGFTEYLTKGVEKRKDPTLQAVMKAIIPFINKELYF